MWHCWVSDVNKQQKQNVKTWQKGGWQFELRTEQNKQTQLDRNHQAKTE